jgi:hypothetical protein
MYMKNKLFPFVLFGLIIFLVGLALQLNASLHQIGYILTGLGSILYKFLGLLLLALNSDILKTIYFKLILLAMAIVILGEVFYLLHWPGSYALIISGAAGVITTYGIRFYLKQGKKRLDILKFLWVLTTYIAVCLIILNIIPKEVGYCCELLFWAMILEHFMLSRKIKTTVA